MVNLGYILGESNKLETPSGFYRNGKIEHKTVYVDNSRGKFQVRTVKTWRRTKSLGRGSFGTVNVEQCTETGELRAVKDIWKEDSPRVIIDDQEQHRAMNVVGMHDRLFVQPHGWFETSSELHLAMEFMDQGNLRSYMDAAWPERATKFVVRQLTEGLAAIHQEGFVHRGLRPENIFVASQVPMRVKIGDFGVAELAGSDPFFKFKAEPAYRYRSPEMEAPITGDSSQSRFGVDLWALGCIVHELLTNANPFITLLDRTKYVASSKFSEDSLQSKAISRQGIEFVKGALALKPENRMTAEQALGSDWLRAL